MCRTKLVGAPGPRSEVHLSNSSIAYPINGDLQSFIFVEGFFFDSIDNKSGFYIMYSHEERDLYADASASRAFSF